MNDSCCVKLTNGSCVEYREYGDPSGFPVIFFHGLFGTCHQSLTVSEIARECRIRLIAPNRPGVGRSSPTRARTVIDRCAGICELTRRLDLDRFSALGVSGGTPYALATATRMPEAVQKVMIVSGIGPLNDRQIRRHFSWEFYLLIQAARFLPPVLRSYFEGQQRRFHQDTIIFCDEMVARLSQVDQIDDNALRTFMLDFHTIFSQPDAARILCQDVGSYLRWGFTLADVPLHRPVGWVHGLSDTVVPLEVGTVMAERLNAKAAFLPGGHLIAFPQTRNILEWLAS